jgi:hypothetical protein
VFDGAPLPRDGMVRTDPTRPGHGLTFKQKDPERFSV